MATLSVAGRNAAIDAVVALLDVGPTRCFLTIRSTIGATIMWNQFIALAGSTWNAAAAGSAALTVAPRNFGNAVASGTVGNSNVITGNNATDSTFSLITAGLVGSGADIEFTNNVANIGQQLLINQLNITMA